MTARDGQRCGTAKAYLVPVEKAANLNIVGNATVTKVVSYIAIKNFIRKSTFDIHHT